VKWGQIIYFCFFLSTGHYEIVFDDGFQWKCTTSRLYKMKDSLTADASFSANAVPSHVQYGTGPSSSFPTRPAYHTHLFDPTRDYLGSKSERREMKRKLNIKEIFNIGQKRPKTTDRKEKVPRKKPQAEKKVRIKPKLDDQIVSKTPKSEIPGALLRLSLNKK
jgi:hypothetical protein